MSVDISSKNMDYLGMVGVLSKDIGVTKIIDDVTGIHEYQNVTHGEATMAMIYNMLAILQRPLYLVANFMNSKPTDRLLSKTIPKYAFNDDILGRTLDKLYEVGLESLFMRISSTVFKKYGEYQSPYFHGDTTLMKVHGEYNNDAYETTPIEITYGWSKDQPKNLKQFIISMITCDNLPVFISTLSGNTSDKKSLNAMMRKYGKQLSEYFDETKTFVFDSAFFHAESIKNCDFPWISRVPENIIEAKDLLINLEEKDFISSGLKGYKIHSKILDYGGVTQRWIVIYSNYAYKREAKTLEKVIENAEEDVKKDIWHFGVKIFKSKIDAINASKELAKTWGYHKIKDTSFTIKLKKKNLGRGRPKNGEKMITYYHLNIEYEVSKVKKSNLLKKKGRFIVATNIINPEVLTDVGCLTAYKDQQKVERGFKFIKDPMFFVDAVYLKNEKRIMSMVMLMGISLIIYSLLEKKLRSAFIQSGELYVDKLAKATNKPTIRRVFNSFIGINLHYTKYDGVIVQEKMANMSPLQRQVLRILGPAYMEMYADRNNGGELIWRPS